MASSSRPFQSQTVSRLVAGYRQLAQGAARILRQGRTALAWGMQVAVYPVYVAFQSIRTGYRRLLATDPWPQLRRLWTGALPPLRLVSTDTPIRSLLAIIQPPEATRQNGLRPVDRQGQFLRQSRAGRVLTNGQWHLLPLTTAVRGIASDLATRQLVLVTADNGLFADLTADQQDRLQRAIMLLLAEYAGVCRRYWLDVQRRSPGLPLPRAENSQWFPFRWLLGGMRWMQTGSLAIATNLFGEASQWQRWRQARPQPALSPGLDLPAIAAPLGHGSAPNLALPATGDWLRGQQGSMGVGPLARASAGLEPITVTQAETEAIQPSPSAQPLTNRAGSHLAGSVGDVLEAKVTLVNYVDHPLAQLLRWLDQILHSAETWLAQLWQWLRTHL